MEQPNVKKSEFNPETIFSLPDENRLGYVLGMNFDVYEQLTRGTAKKLVEKFPRAYINEDELTRTIKNRVETLIRHNTKPESEYKPGVDLSDDSLEALCGTGSLVTGFDMRESFTNPLRCEQKGKLANDARLECLAIASKLLIKAEFGSRATPLTNEYGRVYTEHVLDEKFD